MTTKNKTKTKKSEGTRLREKSMKVLKKRAKKRMKGSKKK